MIIAIDASKAASTQKTGVDNTVYQIILHLRKIDKENTYYLYTNQALNRELLSPNFKEKLVPGRRLWHKFRLPLALFRDRPQAFLELSNSLPACSVPKKYILIHDLAFKYFPEAYSKMELKRQEHTVKSAIEANAKIIVTLLANKNDLIKHYSVNEASISVIPLAFDKAVFKKNKQATNPLKFTEPFFLFVGRLETRKNVANIVRAFDHFKGYGSFNHKLVLVGKPGFGHDAIFKTINNSKHKNDIITAGFIGNDELIDLMSLATSLLYPSYYEGFGLPMLEAFSCELPVITSEAEPLVEIGKDAALTVGAEDIEEISKKMADIVNNDKLRAQLIEKGKVKASQYDWTNTAIKIKELINETS